MDFIGLFVNLFRESIPLGLFVMSVITIGNLLKHVLIHKHFSELVDDETTKRKSLTFDFFTLTSGLIINLIVLFYDDSVLNLNLYLERDTWIRLLLGTFIAASLIFGYRKYGKKWIKDTVLKAIAILFSIIIIYALFSLIVGEINIVAQYNQCSKELICLVKFFFYKFVRISIILFLLYALFKYIQFFSKKRKYKRYM